METVLVANPQVVYSLGTIQINMIAVPVEISPKLDRAEIITNKTKRSCEAVEVNERPPMTIRASIMKIIEKMRFSPCKYSYHIFV